MKQNNKFAEEMSNVVNKICESLKDKKLVNTVILTLDNPNEDVEAGFKVLVSMIEIQSGKKLKAKVEKTNDQYDDGAIHLAYIADTDNPKTLADLFLNK